MATCQGRRTAGHSDGPWLRKGPADLTEGLPQCTHHWPRSQTEELPRAPPAREHDVHRAGSPGETRQQEWNEEPQTGFSQVQTAPYVQGRRQPKGRQGRGLMLREGRHLLPRGSDRNGANGIRKPAEELCCEGKMRNGWR